MLAIEVSIGRTGRATPYAVLEPVVVAGSRASMATLHNEDQVAEKDVRPGDLVIVRKAGDVIPEVVGAVSEPGRRRKSAWKFPATCPECGAPLVRVGEESDTYCVNPRVQHNYSNRSCISLLGAPSTSKGLGESRCPVARRGPHQ